METVSTFFDFNNYLATINFAENKKNLITVNDFLLSTNENNDIIANIVPNNTTFSLVRNKFSKHENCIIICSKDYGSILSYCLNKIKDFGIDKDYDILLVDDRSATEEILLLSDKFNTSYLRVDNSNDIFSYSLINNIAAMYCANIGKKRLIFYNNDLWPDKKETLPNLVNKHIKNQSCITGCRLLYPTEKEYDNLGRPQHILKEYIDKLYDTIQHGGIFFVQGGFGALSPSHLWRYYNKNTTMACVDSRCFAVTGAIQIIDTEDFLSLKGFNIGLTAAFQDISLCIEACKKDKAVFYIGSEYMYHAESLTIVNENITDKTNGLVSDNLLWAIMYSKQLPLIIGLRI